MRDSDAEEEDHNQMQEFFGLKSPSPSPLLSTHLFHARSPPIARVPRKRGKKSEKKTSTSSFILEPAPVISPPLTRSILSDVHEYHNCDLSSDSNDGGEEDNKQLVVERVARKTMEDSEWVRMAEKAWQLSSDESDETSKKDNPALLPEDDEEEEVVMEDRQAIVIDENVTFDFTGEGFEEFEEEKEEEKGWELHPDENRLPGQGDPCWDDFSTFPPDFSVLTSKGIEMVLTKIPSISSKGVPTGNARARKRRRHFADEPPSDSSDESDGSIPPKRGGKGGKGGKSGGGGDKEKDGDDGDAPSDDEAWDGNWRRVYDLEVESNEFNYLRLRFKGSQEEVDKSDVRSTREVKHSSDNLILNMRHPGDTYGDACQKIIGEALRRLKEEDFKQYIGYCFLVEIALLMKDEDLKRDLKRVSHLFSSPHVDDKYTLCCDCLFEIPSFNKEKSVAVCVQSVHKET